MTGLINISFNLQFTSIANGQVFDRVDDSVQNRENEIKLWERGRVGQMVVVD